MFTDHSIKEVEDDLAARGCHLVHLASVAQGEQLPTNEVTNMNIVAGLRNHVGRVMRKN